MKEQAHGQEAESWTRIGRRTGRAGDAGAWRPYKGHADTGRGP